MNCEGINRSSFKHNFLKRVILRLDFQNITPQELNIILDKTRDALDLQGFTRYNKRTVKTADISMDAKDIFEDENLVKSKKIFYVYSFANDDNGIVVDISIKHICLSINAVKYIPFEEYAELFMNVVDIYKENVSLFAITRLGLRKNSLCFVNSIESINKYFNKKYFDYFNLFDNSSILTSEKKSTLQVDDCNINVFCNIEYGKLNNEPMYKLSLDTDIYIDNTESIVNDILNSNKLSSLNEKLFQIYVDSLTDEFGKMLLSDDDIQENDIIGVEYND